MENKKPILAQKSKNAKVLGKKLKKVRFKKLTPAEKLLAMIEANFRAAAMGQKTIQA
jgi:hypothetical protein